MDNISRNIETSGYNGVVWIDKHDSFNRINNLPIEEPYRTFLLDSDNRVLAIGNPIINGGVSNMYIELLGINEPITTSDQHIDLGAFNWKEKQVCRFKILNETDNVLYIDTIIPSCECITYSCYSDSVISGRSFSIYVYYKADSPGMFRRDISVYFEGEEKPLILNIEGEAKLES
ncbi:MAG: DUF1573 domain-containing protein [Marinilabiliaceae bacterium]|nr:DUF1573 domain-containing protein [Marinilabiliaceae bacterium]